jgi:hypothetical protein
MLGAVTGDTTYIGSSRAGLHYPEIGDQERSAEYGDCANSVEKKDARSTAGAVRGRPSHLDWLGHAPILYHVNPRMSTCF